MLEQLFGNVVIEKIFFYLLMNQKGYGSQLSVQLEVPLFSIQKALERLEKGGVLVAQNVGKTRLFTFNPRYPFLKELRAFLTKSYEFLPQAHKTKYYEPVVRRRPRRAGKPLG